MVHLKDFKNWHKVKTKINSLVRISPVYFYEREVWWCSVGHNVRFEQDGKGEEFARPVLILRKFNENFFFGIPLSSTNKQNQYFFEFTYRTGLKSKAALSQLRAYDSNRLIRKDGTVLTNDYVAIQKALVRLLIKKPLK